MGAVDLIRLVAGPAPASIDILPERCPNALPRHGRRPVEVAILRTLDVDPRRVVASSVRLEGIAPSRERSRLRDVPAPAATECSCTAPVAPDGWMDRIFEFDANQLRSILTMDSAGAASWTLTARLDDGRAIAGSDCLSLDRAGVGIAANDASPVAAGQWTIAPSPARRGDRMIIRASGSPSETSVRMSYYDVRGRRVRSLEGTREWVWDGRDSVGDLVPSGVYVARAEGGSVVGRILVLP
jgi:hypothetical protein